jgi:SPP1 gp7 family putative phage head morphogenesis protein
MILHAMRTKPKRPSKWLRPAAVERDYKQYLRGVARDVAQACETAIIPALPGLRQDDYRDIPESEGWYERLRLAFLEAGALIALPGMAERIAAFAAGIERFNRAQFHAVLRSAYGVDIFKAEPWLNEVLRAWEAENIKLIKSIPKQALDRMHGRIVAAVRSGTPTAKLTEWIRDEYGVTRNRADLIARDQVGKLNGQLTEERQTGIGVEEYKWRGSLDERERDEHVEREGQTFSWKEPPSDGNPGEPIQCRCWAEPVLPLLEDIEGLIYTDPMPARGFSRTRRGSPA